jgi:hypothetical protein
MRIKHSSIFIREVRIKTANVDFLYFDIFKIKFLCHFFPIFFLYYAYKTTKII